MTEPARPTLAEERRDLARTRILDAGARALAEHGVGASVDDVARIAGVGRRTIFRYYPTRDQLIAAVIDRIVDFYGGAVGSEHDGDDASLEVWLTAVALRAHDLNARLGNGYWQLLVDPDPPPVVREALDRRHRQRLELSQRLAARAWVRAGQDGEAPAELVDAFTVLLGPLGTAAAVNDAGASPRRAGELAAALLLTHLRTLARAASASTRGSG